MGCPFMIFVDRHFAGALSSGEERTLRLHVPGCAVCTRWYRRHLLLSRLDPRALDATERLARGLGWRSRVVVALASRGARARA